jgi:hypothetical protein
MKLLKMPGKLIEEVQELGGMKLKNRSRYSKLKLKSCRKETNTQ